MRAPAARPGAAGGGGDPTDRSCRRRIRYRRKRLRITLEELARTVGTAPSALSLIENGSASPSSAPSAGRRGHGCGAAARSKRRPAAWSWRSRWSGCSAGPCTRPSAAPTVRVGPG
ncbi:helix-turn-helix transcriptional regulator [Kocuria rhizophila]|nr:helix-turn-helix transcriptional regulator [Kocuria rhizophila]